MNRGSAHQQVFFTTGDALRFEDLLGTSSAATGVEVHAYALMSNHFHLLLRSNDNSVSSFMQRLGSMYTRWLNARLRRDGPVFRSRFNAKGLETWEYVQQVGRYIHRNPKDLPGVQRLDSYRWSSYRHYVNRFDVPPWLTIDSLLGEGDGALSVVRRNGC